MACNKPSWATGVLPWGPHLLQVKGKEEEHSHSLFVIASLSQVLSLFVASSMLWDDSIECEIILICLWSQKLCSNYLSPKSNRKALESIKRQ